MPFTPVGFLAIALIIAAAHYAMETHGWREYVCVLSGTPHTASGYRTAWIRGGIYAIAYFAAVLVAPVLVIAAGLRIILLKR
jgi:hypothetical protein